MSNLKLVTLGMIVALLGAVSCKKGATSSKSPENPKLATKMDSVSYALGNVLGLNLKNAGISDSSELNYDILRAAMQRTIYGDSIVLKEMQVQMLLEAFQRAQMAKRDAEMNKKNAPIVAKNEKEATEFLTKNKTAEGVVTTASGLQYKIIKAGTGAKPAASDKVKVHYTGKLLNGKVFDSSIERKEPATFGVSQVIPGWTEALQLMPVGSKWEVWIPSNLAYGPTGNEAIPGGSMLVFEVELIGIEK
ncbi:MAG: FKBP-type peptidyl-prolyl cis-trans isomerase [Bacteroidia bacterium]